MAHFAEIDENNIITRVIVAEQDFIDSGTVGNPSNWIQTSYNASFRKQYAGIGGTYNAEKDIFIAKQNYPSWVLDSNDDWQPPVPYPNDVSVLPCWYWDESITNWVEYEEDE